MPVRGVGPLTTRGGVIAGLRDFSSIEFGGVDNRRHRHLDDFGLRLALAGLPELGVEAVSADIGRSGQHLVDRIDAPLSAIARADTGGVQMGGDRLDAHRA
jgi:hypothetical protein